jgi:hypothetical protein
MLSQILAAYCALAAFATFTGDSTIFVIATCFVETPPSVAATLVSAIYAVLRDLRASSISMASMIATSTSFTLIVVCAASLTFPASHDCSPSPKLPVASFGFVTIVAFALGVFAFAPAVLFFMAEGFFDSYRNIG